MSRPRLFLWTVFVVLAAAYAPMVAGILGYQLAGSLWSALRLDSPWLSQAGDVLAGALGGALIGLVQWLIVPPVHGRWVGLLAAGGVIVGLAHAVYPPAMIVAVPLAAGLAALLHTRRPDARFVRAQGIAGAWIALALLLPFPHWVTLAFLVAAALVSALGVRAAYGPAPVPAR